MERYRLVVLELSGNLYMSQETLLSNISSSACLSYVTCQQLAGRGA